jgi:hypothetical protein
LKKKRDSQKSKVYKSERELKKKYIGYMKSQEETEAYIHKVFASYFVRANFPDKKWDSIQVKFGYGRPWADHSIGVIKLSSDLPDCNKLISLHEIAHILTPGEWHSRVYVNAYLKLVKRFLGKEAWAELKSNFRKNGVKWQNKRILTAEHKQILRDRINNARLLIKGN